MTTGLRVNAHVTLRPEDIQESFIRAPGPGGQNVNKVASAVQLKFDVANCPALPEPVRARLAQLCGRRLSGEGVLIIEAHRFRTQSRNRDDAREKLFDLIRQACVVPKARKATRPSATARRKRVEDKRARGDIKRARRSVEE